MGRQTSRPFLPCGSYELKKNAVAAAKELNELFPDQKWKAIGKFGSQNRYAIQREK
jgi:hypothetical protein